MLRHLGSVDIGVYLNIYLYIIIYIILICLRQSLSMLHVQDYYSSVFFLQVKEDFYGDSFLIWYWLNQHGKDAMLDMPLWSCQLQQHILADPVNSF